MCLASPNHGTPKPSSVFMLRCRCSFPGAKNTPSVTSRLNRSIMARLNHCFHASVHVLPSLSQKDTRCNVSPKSVNHGSPKPPFSCFGAGAPFPESKTHQVYVTSRLNRSIVVRLNSPSGHFYHRKCVSKCS